MQVRTARPDRMVDASARVAEPCGAMAALLEYHANHNDKVARNIFQLGLRRFQKEPEFILHYAQFLSDTHDDASACPAAAARACHPRLRASV